MARRGAFAGTRDRIDRRVVTPLMSISLVRNSIHIMGATVVTSGLGYLYWIIAARAFPADVVGLASGLVSFATAASLFTHLGLGALLIERLPRLEGTRAWAKAWSASLIWGGVLTAVVTALLIVIFRHALHVESASSQTGVIAMVIIGATLWTITNLLDYVYISARRSELVLWLNGLISGIKLAMLIVLAPFVHSAEALVFTWVGSAFVGTLIGFFVLNPRLKLGGAHWPTGLRPTTGLARGAMGHHLASSAGVLVPYVLPVMVVIRLGANQNAYFYASWMVAGTVFLVGPSVASSLFSETVRAPEKLRHDLRTSLRIVALAVTACAIVLVILGKPILHLFGPEYAAEGYTLLLVLTFAAYPDAISSIAVGALRATGRVHLAIYVNVFMAISCFVLSWVLLPPLGIVGAGLGWLIAQVLGTIAVTPWMWRLAGPGAIPADAIVDEAVKP